MALPVSYKDFLKNPIVGILFISLTAISYLYLDNKSNYLNVMGKQEKRITDLESRVENLNIKINQRDSVIYRMSIEFSDLSKRAK
jgi:hypothetical protein